MRNDIYCNCEAPCIYKSVELQKIKIWEKGKVYKQKYKFVCVKDKIALALTGLLLIEHLDIKEKNERKILT